MGSSTTTLRTGWETITIATLHRSKRKKRARIAKFKLINSETRSLDAPNKSGKSTFSFLSGQAHNRQFGDPKFFNLKVGRKRSKQVTKRSKEASKTARKGLQLAIQQNKLNALEKTKGGLFKKVRVGIGKFSLRRKQKKFIKRGGLIGRGRTPSLGVAEAGQKGGFIEVKAHTRNGKKVRASKRRR